MEAVRNLQVFDAHTHLAGEKLQASDFWEIVHYFWFLRELRTAGYSDNPEFMPEDNRIELFLDAYKAAAGTGMHYAVKYIFNDLYGLKLDDIASVREAIDRVKQCSADGRWVESVSGKANLTKTVVNNESHKNFIGLNDTCIWFPRLDGMLHDGARRIAAENPSKRAVTANDTAEQLRKTIDGYVSQGVRAFMTSLGGLDTKTYRNSGESFRAFDDGLIFLLRILCQAASSNNLTIQLFMGMEHGHCSVAVPVNRTGRVVNLYGLFEDYPCKFDLVTSCGINNMDIANAAQIFPNVYAGGMWWFNFRPSTYLSAMAQRFEALSSRKSYLTISDSRCIEWCYGKIALIKKLTGDFLCKKVSDGYVDTDEALIIAKDWLYSTPAKLYT